MDEQNNINEENYGAKGMDDDNPVVSLSDILHEQEELEEDAAAVLGGSDEKYCTYSKGYVKRQALYACVTCVPEAKDNPKKRAGICLACTYKCHDGHDFIELYTKRNFRCDCGTSKILAIRCKLEAQKVEDCDQNKYNHNFSGTYCVCERPYPDPDDDVDDEMIQCVICEDWYHLRHLEGKVPGTNDFDEMICQLCTKQHSFLNHYSHLCVLQKDDENSIADVNVTQKESADGEPNAKSANDDTAETKADGEVQKDNNLDDELNQCIRDIIEINKSNQQPESGPSTSTSSATAEDSPPRKKQKCDESVLSADVASGSNVCRKPETIFHQLSGATFWANDWRNALCQCTNCMEMYKNGDVEFITDVEDTVHHYTEKGKAKGRASSEDVLMSAISNMDHIAKIEAITCYNKLKSKLTEFLAAFVSKNEVITESDVKHFFQSMSNDDKTNN